VQYAPELLGVIKRWSDRDPAPGRYLGSATRLEVSDDGCGFMWFPGRPP
jgi:hypothetical protein